MTPARPGSGGIEPGSNHPELRNGAGEKALDRLDKRRHAKGDVSTAEMRLQMQHIMQNHCAVFRTGEILQEGKDKLSDLWSRNDDIQVADTSMIWNSDLIETLEYDNLIAQSVVSLHSALNREESRGGHAREDFPDRDDDNWMKHTVIWMDDDGSTRIDYRPVHNYTLTNDVQAIPPKARVY